MTTKTTTSLLLGWRRYRWPLLRAQLTAHFRCLDIDPWLIMAALVVAAIVVYGRTQAPPTVTPAPIAQSTSRPIVIMATVLVVPTTAPTAIPTAEPPTAAPTDEPPPPPVEADSGADEASAVQLAAPTVAPPTPTADYPAWYTDIPTPAPWLVAACESEAGRQSWVCGGPGDRKTKP